MIKHELFKKIVLTFLSAVVAVFLMRALLDELDISFDTEVISPILSKFNIWWVFLFLFLIFASIYLAALRWRFIAGKLNANNTGIGFYYFYILLAWVVGAVLPQQLSYVFVRSASMKVVKGNDLSKSSFSVIYDGLISAYVAFLSGVPSVLLILGIIDFQTASVFVVVLLVSGLLCGAFFHQVCFVAAFDLLRKIKSRLRKKSKSVSVYPKINDCSLFSKRSFTFIFLIALVQNFLLVLSNYVLVYSLDLDIDFYKVFYSYPAIFFSEIIGLTPGGIGIREWTWTGVLVSFGETVKASGQYSLINRFFITLTQLFSLILLVGVVGFNFFFKKKAD